MNDIQDKIAEIMADPQALKQVQSLGKMLGLNKELNFAENQQSTSLNSVSEINNTPQTSMPFTNNPINSEIMTKIIKIMPLINQANQEDDVSKLLKALRPFLSNEKCKKLDSAKKIIQVLKIIPLLKEGGILDSQFF